MLYASAVLHSIITWITAAVGVMANNKLRLHHSARKIVFGEKTIMRWVLWRLWYFHNETRSGLCRPWMRRNWGKGILALTPFWSPDWTCRRKELLPGIVSPLPLQRHRRRSGAPATTAKPVAEALPWAGSGSGLYRQRAPSLQHYYHILFLSYYRLYFILFSSSALLRLSCVFASVNFVGCLFL